MRHLRAFRLLSLAACSAAATAAPILLAQDTSPVFRATGDAVRVDVSVKQGGRPVRGLGAKDFQILDNAVRQDIADVTFEKVPIDVTVALDVSTSVSGRTLDQLRRGVTQLRSRLSPADRLALLTFNMRVHRLVDTGGVADLRALDRIVGSGSTSLLDAVTVALATRVPDDRRQLLIVFTDGSDTSSVTTAEGVLDVARRTTPTVSFVRPVRDRIVDVRPDASVSPAARIDSESGRLDRPTVSSSAVTTAMGAIYVELARETGGVVLQPAGSENLANTFTRVLDDFRSSYVLYFIPRGAGSKGFHSVRVDVTRPGQFNVLARRGYVVD